MKTKVSLRYFVSYSLQKGVFDSNLPHTPSNLISLALLLTLRLFTHFKSKIRAINWQESSKIGFTW